MKASISGRSKQLILLFIMLTAVTVLAQQHPVERQVRIKRTYLDSSKRISEIHYDLIGRKIKSIQFDVRMGHHLLFTVDSIVDIFEYDTVNHKMYQYEYTVEHNLKDSIKLKTIYEFYENGNTKSIDYSHKALADEYFFYDSRGNLIKDSSDVIYLIHYTYSKDLLHIMEKTCYKNSMGIWVFSEQYEYNSLNQLVKINRFNYDNKLIQVTAYTYDLKGNKISEVTTSLDIYTTPRQRKDKVSSYTYEYDSDFRLIKVIGIGQWDKPRVISYTYEYY